MRGTVPFLFINTINRYLMVVGTFDLEYTFLSWAPVEVNSNLVALWMMFHAL
jgi:hypothetical protein